MKFIDIMMCSCCEPEGKIIARYNERSYQASYVSTDGKRVRDFAVGEKRRISGTIWTKRVS